MVTISADSFIFLWKQSVQAARTGIMENLAKENNHRYSP